MELKKLWIILGSAVLLLIAGAGGYYMGKAQKMRYTARKRN